MQTLFQIDGAQLLYSRRHVMARKCSKILCTLDFSNNALEALDHAADITRPRVQHGRVLVLHLYMR
jgi:hypothetical protein